MVDLITIVTKTKIRSRSDVDHGKVWMNSEKQHTFCRAAGLPYLGYHLPRTGGRLHTEKILLTSVSCGEMSGNWEELI